MNPNGILECKIVFKTEHRATKQHFPSQNRGERLRCFAGDESMADVLDADVGGAPATPPLALQREGSNKQRRPTLCPQTTSLRVDPFWERVWGNK
jgi:hypothetical protein